MAKNKIKKTDLYVLKEELGIKQFNAFPRDISLDYNEKLNKLKMTLTQEAACFLKKGKDYINMQDNRACFEAWCLIIKAQTKTTIRGLEIELDVEDINDSSYPSYRSGRPANGHLGRFLYRILKFSEQYKWFGLSNKLEKIKKKFKNYLDKHSFVTSAPSKKPKANIANCNLESYIEYLYCDSISAQKDILKLPSGTAIDRQLPVSLFEGTKGKVTRVFTGVKSAIDFWALDGDTINVYELKSDNPMVGIITEIFFYSNYVYDVFISQSLDHGKGCVELEDRTDRSYDKIKIGRKQVKGIMLSNRWHARLDDSTRDEIIKIMNDNSMPGAIQYEFVEYQIKKRNIKRYSTITLTP